MPQGGHGGYPQQQWNQQPPRRDGPPMGGPSKFRNEVIVRGLSFKASESDIEDFFNRIGKVESINLQRNPDRTSKGVCFVRFFDEQAMNDAIEKSGIDFMDRKIHIEKTRPTGERAGGFGGDRPGGFGGRGGYGAPRDDFRRDDRDGGRDGGRPHWDRRDDRDQDRERSRDQDRNGGGGWNRAQNQSKTVFVGNLNFTTNESALRDFFEDCGQIKDVRITAKPDGRVSAVDNRARVSLMSSTLMRRLPKEQ